MDTFTAVKARLGIFYDDPINDAQIQSQIDAAIQFMCNSGINPQAAESPLGVNAITMLIQHWRTLDSAGAALSSGGTTLNPMLIAIVGQLRAV